MKLMQIFMHKIYLRTEITGWLSAIGEGDIMKKGIET